MKRNFTQKIATGLDVPTEALRPIPMGTFRGKEELCLENHRGVLAYTSEMIRIAVHQGTVVIHGRELRITNMSKRGICLRGVIKIIELE